MNRSPLDDWRAMGTGNRLAVVVAVGVSLLYCLAKVHLAIRAEMGMPGIPLADAETDLSARGIRLRQLGNAAVGLLAAVLALATLMHHRAPVDRLLAVALWAAGVGMALGVGSIAARTMGLADGLGAIPITPASVMTNLCGLALISAWVVLTARVTRRALARRP